MTISSPPARTARWVVLSLLLATGGCGTATMEDAVPTSAANGLPAGPLDTGTYPNLNVQPGRAASQFTPAERQALAGQLTGAKARQQAETGASTTASKAELDALRARRGQEVLKEIEGPDATE